MTRPAGATTRRAFLCPCVMSKFFCRFHQQIFQSHDEASQHAGQYCGAMFENEVPTCAWCGKPADVRMDKPGGTFQDYFCFTHADKLNQAEADKAQARSEAAKARYHASKKPQA